MIVALMKNLLPFLILQQFLTVAFAQEETVNNDPRTCDATAGNCGGGDLYEDTSDMLQVAMHTYGYWCMRKLVNKFPDKFENTQLINNGIMEQIDSTRIISFANDNKDALEKLKDDKPGEFSMECDGSLHRLWDRERSNWPENDATVSLNDENRNEDLAYGIVINHRKKRIIVSFRGSETGEDWKRNFSYFIDKDWKNPHYRDDQDSKQPKAIGLHTGYRDYLLKDRWFTNRKKKYDTIKKDLQNVLQQHQGYQLFITGHSLGAAIATIFSFHITSESSLKIPKPVTLISFASPQVGNEEWQKAYQYLEKDGVLRHLRVSVAEDMVPTYPSFLDANYKHTGINLELQSHPLKYSFTPFKHSYVNELKSQSDYKNWIDKELHWHIMPRYDERLIQAKSQLEGKQLEELYRDEQVLGDFHEFQ